MLAGLKIKNKTLNVLQNKYKTLSNQKRNLEKWNNIYQDEMKINVATPKIDQKDIKKNSSLDLM